MIEKIGAKTTVMVSLLYDHSSYSTVHFIEQSVCVFLVECGSVIARRTKIEDDERVATARSFEFKQL